MRVRAPTSVRITSLFSRPLLLVQPRAPFQELHSIPTPNIFSAAQADRHFRHAPKTRPHHRPCEAVRQCQAAYLNECSAAMLLNPLRSRLISRIRQQFLFFKRKRKDPTVFRHALLHYSPNAPCTRKTAETPAVPS